MTLGLLVGLATLGQTQVGLPEIGVILGGTVDAPVVLNNSGRPILEVLLRLEDANGHWSVVEDDETSKLQSGQPVDVGISLRPEMGPAVKVTLEAVIFADGESVDLAKLKPNTRVFIRAGKDIWDQVEAYQVVCGGILQPQ